MDITMLAGPVIGSVIGYCTNYVAVKMLFYPRKELRLLGHKVPFTPGAIPKGKDRLAGAIGNVVGNTLLTQEDIEKKLLSDDVSSMLSETIGSAISVPVREGIVSVTKLPDTSVSKMQAGLSAYITNMIVEALLEVDYSTILASKGPEIVLSKINNPMIAMFLSADTLSSMLAPMGDEIKKLISESGFEYINPLVSDKLDALMDESVKDIGARFELDESMITNMINSVLMSVVKGQLSKVMEKLDIKSIVEEKINMMSVEQLEELVMTVMKKELSTIVNLGALIGLILGLFNMLF